MRKMSDADLRHELSLLEQPFQMSSQHFYDRFRAGELGDRREYIRWAGLCHTAIRHGLISQAPQRA